MINKILNKIIFVNLGNKILKLQQQMIKNILLIKQKMMILIYQFQNKKYKHIKQKKILKIYNNNKNHIKNL